MLASPVFMRLAWVNTILLYHIINDVNIIIYCIRVNRLGEYSYQPVQGITRVCLWFFLEKTKNKKQKESEAGGVVRRNSSRVK